MGHVSKDIHVWCKGEDERMVPLYTISVGRSGLCIDAPIDIAVESLRGYLEEMATEAADAPDEEEDHATL